jgi:hypothetical protein
MLEQDEGRRQRLDLVRSAVPDALYHQMALNTVQSNCQPQ